MRLRSGKLIRSGRVFKPEVSHDGCLSLYVNPQPQECPLPRLSHLKYVDLTNTSQTDAKVNGRPCRILVDSGSTHTLVTSTMAKELGLINQISRYETIEMNLWDKQMVTEEVGCVENVEIEISNGVKFYCNVWVWSWETGKSEFVLDFESLHRNRMVQQYYKYFSSLYFRDPKKLRRKLPGSSTLSDGRGLVFATHCAPDLQDIPMSVLLDTGAPEVYIRKGLLRAIQSAAGNFAKPIRNVKIHLGAERAIIANLYTHETPDVDIILGRSILAQYGAILDYGQECLHFQLDGKAFKIQMRVAMFSEQADNNGHGAQKEEQELLPSATESLRKRKC